MNRSWGKVSGRLSNTAVFELAFVVSMPIYSKINKVRRVISMPQISLQAGLVLQVRDSVSSLHSVQA